MNKTMSKNSLFLLMSVCLYVPTVQASGYHFGTQSVTSQSTANASSAEAADASTIFYNPAGISKLEGTNFSVNANLVMPDVTYSNAEVVYPVGRPVSGKDSGSITDSAVVVPHLYASQQLGDNWTAGLGVYIPFASGTEYDTDSVIRYNVNKTEVKTIDINPVVSYKINDQHSVAVGITGQYTDASFRQYANWGAFPGIKYPEIPQMKALYGKADGYADVKGNDWGVGYTLGYLWDVNDKVRLGVSYRSKVHHTLKGKAKWKPDNDFYKTKKGKDALAGIRAAGYVGEEDVSVDLVTPESLSLHGKVDINDRWTAFGDVTWARHSRFNEVNIEFENNKLVQDAQKSTLEKPVLTQSHTTTLQPNWRNTYKIGLGAAYQYNDNLQLRFGAAYDQTPVKSPDYRLSTMPDNDRIWLSVGGKYDINKDSSINLGYSYLHVKDAKANVNGFCGSLSAGGPNAKSCVSSRTKGSVDYKGNAHILGIQYNHRF